jgi:hypothetical protein
MKYSMKNASVPFFQAETESIFWGLLFTFHPHFTQRSRPLQDSLLVSRAWISRSRRFAIFTGNTTMNKIGALILAVALVIGGFLLRNGMHEFRSASRSVSVRGFAEKPVKANFASWRLEFTSKAKTLDEATAAHAAAQEKLTAFLQEHGLSGDEVKPGIPRASENLETPEGNDKPVRTYQIQDWVTISSPAIDKVARVAGETSKLLSEGVFLSGYQEPNFYFTELSNLKPPMISDAMQDGKKAAAQFAKDSGCGLGELQSASQGLFTIRGAIEGAEENTQVDKVVRVVVSLEYKLASCGVS